MKPETQEIIDRIKLELCSLEVKYLAGKYDGFVGIYCDVVTALKNRLEELENQPHPGKTI